MMVYAKYLHAVKCGTSIRQISMLPPQVPPKPCTSRTGDTTDLSQSTEVPSKALSLLHVLCFNLPVPRTSQDSPDT